jgi:transposase
MRTDNQKYFIGLDLHKNTSTFCVKDRDGAVVDERKLATEPSTFKGYLKRFVGSEIAVEPLSQWYFYADMIQNMGLEVKLAHPKRVRAIASARIKTDTIDSGVLADLLRSNLLPEAYFCSKETRDWKEMTRFRASLVRLRSQVKGKVHNILFKNGLKHHFSDLFGKAGREWMQSLELKECFGFNLLKYLALIDMLDGLVNEAEERIVDAVTNHPQAKLLTTIPCVKYVSALTIMAEIGDINRFPSAKKLQGYAGLVPSTYASGGTTRHGRLTKEGSRWLRWTMVEIAQRQLLLRKKIGFGWYYRKVKARKGSGAAAAATARKILAVVWRILKDDRPFEDMPPELKYQEARRFLVVSR